MEPMKRIHELEILPQPETPEFKALLKKHNMLKLDENYRMHAAWFAQNHHYLDLRDCPYDDPVKIREWMKTHPEKWVQREGHHRSKR